MRKLYFVRHGLSEANLQRMFADKDSPLTDEGIKQAARAAKKLRNSGVKYDLIIASPMRRAHHTAQIIAEGLGYPLQAIELNPLLIERNYGELVGTSSRDFFDRYSVADVDNIEGAEGLEELHDRAKKALAFVVGKEHDTILIVGHGASGRALRRAVTKRPYTDEFKESSSIDNAEIIELI